MKARTKQIQNTVLELTATEASWLKGVMQNPLWGQTPEEEDSFDRENRENLFHALDWI